MTRQTTGDGPQQNFQRLQLRYCERCGLLGVAPVDEPLRVCWACANVLRWIEGKNQGGSK